MRRVDTLLQELRVELTNAPAEPSNEAAIERAVETCIVEVRRLNTSDRVSLRRDTLEAVVQHLEKSAAALDDTGHALLKSAKEALGISRSLG
jgi:hypothetical protein